MHSHRQTPCLLQSQSTIVASRDAGWIFTHHLMLVFLVRGHFHECFMPVWGNTEQVLQKQSGSLMQPDEVFLPDPRI